MKDISFVKGYKTETDTSEPLSLAHVHSQINELHDKPNVGNVVISITHEILKENGEVASVTNEHYHRHQAATDYICKKTVVTPDPDHEITFDDLRLNFGFRQASETLISSLSTVVNGILKGEK